MDFSNKHVKRMLEHLWGPTGSILIHILLIIILVKFVDLAVREKTSEIEVEVVEIVEADLEKFEKDLKMLEELPDMMDRVTPPDVDMEMEQPPDVQEFSSEDVDLNDLNINAAQSPLVMKGLFASRSDDGRENALDRYAGAWGKYTEVAVLKALDWLKRHQEADGSWKPRPVPMTSLAILTFLAHGEKLDSDKYGETLSKAIRYLLSKQNDDGSFSKTTKKTAPYEHPIAAYAISEAYALTRIPDLKPAMEKSVQIMIDGQQGRGGWDYSYKKEGRRDTGISGWHVQALKAAYLAGAANQGLKGAMDRALDDLRTSHNSDTGVFGYTDPGWGSVACSAIGALSFQLLGHGHDKEARGALNALKGTTCDWAKPGQYALYTWYYVTQAKFHQGGQTWKGWNNKFARVLTKNQNPDGSWTAPGGAADVEHGKETNYGAVYATTFAALTLEVYYRFLPTYKKVKQDKVDETEEDDVLIRIY